MVTHEELISIGLNPNDVMCYRGFTNLRQGVYVLWQDGTCRFQSKDKDVRKHNVNTFKEVIDFIYEY